MTLECKIQNNHKFQIKYNVPGNPAPENEQTASVAAL